MSNELIVTNNAPTFAVAFGTKKAPQSLVVDAVGVGLTTGKAGREARASLSKSMPELARDGRFSVFAAFLVATFPKLVAGYKDRIQYSIDTMESRATDGGLSADETDMLAKVKADPLNCRAGFDALCKHIIKCTSAEGAKVSKAQAAALELVQEYGKLCAARAAELAAKRAQQTPQA